MISVATARRRRTLLPAAVARRLPQARRDEHARCHPDRVAEARLWAPWGERAYYLCALDRATDCAWGVVEHAHGVCWREVSLADLSAVVGPGEVGVEVDRRFVPATLRELGVAP